MRTTDEDIKFRLALARERVDETAIYSHYRHAGSRYKVVAVALMEATEQPCVIYQNLHHPELIWIRELGDWLATVPDDDGQLIPRFRKVTE